MIEPWSDEAQLTLDATGCACFGSLGCAHVVPRAAGRLSPVQADFDTRMLEVGGFDFSTVVARPQRPLVLPPVLPVVDGSAVCHGVFRPTVVVPLDAVPRALPPAGTLHAQLKLPADVDALVSLFDKDRVLEAIWRDRGVFVPLLAALRPSGVLVPSYSTWAGDPWTEHRYAIKRSFEFFRILQDHGILAIPHLAWGRRVDAEDLVSWLNGNRVDTVAVDAQCLGPLFDRWLGELAWLRERLDGAPSLLVCGIHPGMRLRQIVHVWPEVSFIYNGLRLAASYRELRIGADGRPRRVRHAPMPTLDRPNLGLQLPEEDVSAALLYQRSLREFERVIALTGRSGAAEHRHRRAHHGPAAGMARGLAPVENRAAG